MSEIAACTLIQEEPDRKTERYHDDVQGLPGCGDSVEHSSGNAWHLPEECVSAGQAE